MNRHWSSCLPRRAHVFLCAYRNASSTPNVCIVGSGPAGFYTAQQILKGHQNAIVDIYEKLPVPFGLVRYGVAPDHPDVKNVMNTFTQTASNCRCNFYGNVEIGKDLSLDDLRRAYNAVVLSYGASEDRKLGIPGEDLKNVISARTFVGWYNGLPEDGNLRPDLTCTDTAVVIGQGNVAVDVARILLTSVDALRRTDISDYALECLSKSRIKRVHLIGRRGPLQAAFTIKEFRELVKLPNSRTILDKKYFQGLEDYLKTAPRPRKRLTELLMKTAAETSNEMERLLMIDFLRSPVEFIAENGSVRQVKLAVNKLEGPVGEKQVAVRTVETERIDTGLVLTSIGYRSRGLSGTDLPFDQKKGVVLNTNGRVESMPGVYCSGWLKNGPIGVILSTMTDGFNVGKAVIDDLNQGLLGDDSKIGYQSVEEILQRKGGEVVTWEGWERIDCAEVQSAAHGSPRRKITTIEEMLRLVRTNSRY